MINQHNHFIAEVRNIVDPFKSGKVQIRIYGNHDDEHEILDEHLPWALTLQPITSAATSKIGIIPTGMIVGSRVFGVFIDKAHQQPVILGTFPRGSKLLQDSATANEGGQETLDPNQKGVDVPEHGHPEDNNTGKTPNSVKVGGTAVDPMGAKYNNAPFVENSNGPQGLDVAKSKFAPNSNEATIAAVDPSTDLPAALQQVGTSGTIMPTMISALNSVGSIMSMMNQTNTNNNTSTNTGVNQYAIAALTGALSILSNKYGFNIVIRLFSVALTNYFNDINPAYSTILSESLLNFINNGVQYNYINLPYNMTPITNLIGNNIPTPVVSDPPDFYVQQYYSASTDLYPGYIQWEGPTGDYVYTQRTSLYPNYSSADEALIDVAQTEFVALFTPFFASDIMTYNDINNILSIVVPDTQNNAANNSLGNNSSLNIMGLITSLLGTIGGMINSADSNHLPKSVLNISSMTQTLQKFASNLSYLQQMKNKSMQAFAVPSSSMNLASLLSSTSSFNVSLGSSGGLDAQSVLSLMSSGISSSLVSSLNNITMSNSLSANVVNTIASITSELSSSGANPNDIISIQNLLAQII